jgi:hypothetical protein
MTRSDLWPSRRSNTATTAPSVSLISATDSAATLENHGNSIPGCREANDALCSPTVNRATRTGTMNTLGPQSPTLPSATDSDREIVGRSVRELNAENTGHPLPDPSRNQYEMV